MFSISCGQYTFYCKSAGLPLILEEYCKHARLVDEIELKSTEGEFCFVAVEDHSDWPFLVVIQRYSPSEESGFYPGVILIPETKLLLIGAGERLLAYDLVKPERLWEDRAEGGFFGWKRHDDMIVMSAELELAAWDLHGRRRWSTFVEPSWSYSVEKGRVALDVEGKKSAFPLKTGPPLEGS